MLLVSIPDHSPAADFIIDAVADAGDAAPGDGYCDSILAGFDCTLRAAIQPVNALAGPDIILIPNPRPAMPRRMPGAGRIWTSP